MTKAELEAGLAAVAAGDSNALAELYRAYYQPVFLLAASLTGDAALAEDTVQEVFLTVQTCAGRYRPAPTGGRGCSASPAMWPAGSCGAPTTTRWTRRSPTPCPRPAGRKPAAWRPCSSAKRCGCSPPGEYPVVVLHVFAGLKLTEIARYLDIPYGTVLWRYSEGKKKLKRYYEQLDKGERRETHVG